MSCALPTGGEAREVKALLIEMSMLPIHAPSIRTCATRFPPASTTAMFHRLPNLGRFLLGCGNRFASGF
jgi:hypothetical protein